MCKVVRGNPLTLWHPEYVNRIAHLCGSGQYIKRRPTSYVEMLFMGGVVSIPTLSA